MRPDVEVKEAHATRLLLGRRAHIGLRSLIAAT